MFALRSRNITSLFNVAIGFSKNFNCNFIFSFANFRRNMSVAEESKRKRMIPKIGTHNGVFHCDEVLACFMLLQIEDYKDSEIIRTRDAEVLNNCDIVVDVGGIYDKTRHRYDHHQREFQHTLSSLRPECGSRWNIRLSSAGLIYTHFGERVIASIVKKHSEITLPEKSLNAIYLKVYENFIQEIDGIDNGVPMCEVEPAYHISTNLSSRVGNFNPSWNSPDIINEDEQFGKALLYAGQEFAEKVLYYTVSWLPARDLVIECLSQRTEVHSSGEIMELKGQFPWKDHLFDLEKEQSIEGVLKFVIFQDKGGAWRVQAVPVKPTSFVLRKPLLQKWWGQRDAKLEEISGIPGTIFCHATGFIGGNESREGALEMALQSLAAA